MKHPVTLSHEFSGVLDQLEYTADHLFITGRAGTGKSTLLQVFRSTTKKRVAVLAPTGIAALNVRGQTIHSFFGFPPRLLNKTEIEKRPNNRVYKNLDMIIIDEISMVRADLLDNMDLFLQKNRNDRRPFGGVQMVYFGDLFQLPPVVSTPFEKNYFSTVYPTPYFFSAFVLHKTPLQMVELTQVYRQEEKNFISLLDNIRKATLELEDFELLNSRHIPPPERDDYYITLSSRNDIANRINQAELDSIMSPAVEFKASIKGEFNPHVFPTDLNLPLKEGAQVMFVRNDLQKQYVNGTIGIVSELNPDRVIVKIEGDNDETKFVQVEPQDWEIIRYEADRENPGQVSTRVIGTFTQLPLKLAWAITIHKSQGKTFDKVIIDMGGGAFESGQTYVALSRCRTLDGIVLRQPLRNRDIFVDERICEYYQQIKYLS